MRVRPQRAPTHAGHGGRRHCRLSAADEIEFIAWFEHAATVGSRVTVDDALERLRIRCGRGMTRAGMYKLLKRHGFVAIRRWQPTSMLTETSTKEIFMARSPETTDLLMTLSTRPDARWALADAIVGTPAERARELRRLADDHVRCAVSFIAANRACQSISRWDTVARAYVLWTRPDEPRLEVECLLLAGEPVAVVETEVGIPATVIDMYRVLFFDVVGRGQPWLDRALLNGLTGFDSHPHRDHRLRQYRFAMLLGKDYRAARSASPSPEIERRVTDIGNTILKAKQLGALIEADDQAVLDISVRRGGHSMTLASASTPVSTTVDEAYGTEVLKFLQSIPLIVADPTDPKNLTLPAREPRAHEYIAAHATGLDVHAYCRELDTASRAAG